MGATTFTPDTERLLDSAEAFCVSRHQRLTEQRRQVLGLILDSPRPSGAYDLLDRMRVDGKPTAPPTVYRALEFLTAQGLVHKIERLSAFVGCAHMLQSASPCGHSHGHAQGIEAIQFLICTHCRRVFEITDDRIRTAIDAAAQAQGFRPAGATVEIEGTCAECLADAAAAQTQIS
ncbi:Fur family transcriptional regulator [Acidisoma silvae]|uniref:Transcriptional repressor n=1 Tax=Acidisoma silvae TaxID=2802396 RepID=A0A963YMZ2_9PROT|nr:Fur family transcriptional regulator [Acidisoma silvae]MCB8873567.1 transcriptional repressor [Acidisoma silvae]